MKKFFYTITLFLLVTGLMAQAFPPTIDAQRDPWWATLTSNKEGFIYLPPDAVFAGQEDQIEDEVDLSGLCWIAWDETYLYAYLEVMDELVQVNNATNYQNDNVEFKMDPDPTAEESNGGGVAAVRMTALGEDMAEVPDGVDDIIGGNELEGEFYTNWVAEGGPVEGEDYARMETDKGYNVEWRLPFEAIQRTNHDNGELKSVVVGEGSLMGLAVNIGDNDGTQRDCMLNWSATHEDPVWNNCPGHGTIWFLADHKFRMENVNYYSGEAPVSDSTWYVAPEWYLSVDPVLDNNLPMEFELAQNYPNPFNPTTTIPFSLNKAEKVTLAVYDVSGQLINTLINDQSYAQGKYTATWNGCDNTGAMVASGVYLYQLKAGNRVESRKMLLVK